MSGRRKKRSFSAVVADVSVQKKLPRIVQADEKVIHSEWPFEVWLRRPSHPYYQLATRSRKLADARAVSADYSEQYCIILYSPDPTLPHVLADYRKPKLASSGDSKEAVAQNERMPSVPK